MWRVDEPPLRHGAYSRRNKAAIVTAIVLAPLLGLAIWSLTLGAAFEVLGLDALCAFDPPPGDHFDVGVLNDTPAVVMVQPTALEDATIRLRPGARDDSLTGSCGAELRILTPQRRLLGCLDESPQDVPEPAPPLRVSQVQRCVS